MHNPETMATLDTQDTGGHKTQKQNTTRKTKMNRNTDSTKNRGINPGIREG